MANPIYIIKRLFGMNYKNFFKRADSVSKKSGKNKFAIYCDMIWCGFKYGAGYVDYDVIGFYKLNNKQRETMLTRGINNKYVKKLNQKEYWHIYDNKNEFNNMFSKFITRDWIYPISENKNDTIEFFKKHEIFMAKPNNGQCGKGIEKISVKDYKENYEKLYNHLVDNKLELVEELIVQHDEMNRLNTSSVNTIRMVTAMNEQNEVTVLATFIRIGNGKHVDNFNSGGMTAKVDEDTGIILEEAVDKSGKLYEKHPITGTTIKGFQIPEWNEALSMVKEAASMSRNVRYVGWDVAITNDGVTLIEGNQFPGHDIYQVAERMEEGSFGILPKFKKAIGY